MRREDDLKIYLLRTQDQVAYFDKDSHNVILKHIDLFQRRASSFDTHEDNQGTDSNPHHILQASHVGVKKSK
jgi:hypothetical protein